MDKIKTLTAENTRLRALNRKLKQRINMLRTITTEEAKLATGMDCTIDDILEAIVPEGGQMSKKIDSLSQYLKIRNHGLLIKDQGGDLFFYRHHIPDAIPINHIERVLWCEKGDEYIFRRTIEGCGMFISHRLVENWENYPEIHGYGMIALIGHCGDAGKSPIPQDLSHYVVL